MHIAASKPEVIDPKDLPEEMLAKEHEIFVAQAKESGKPEAIIEKMVAGKMQKFKQEISLVGQPFVKDPSITVGELLKQHNAAVNSMVRFEVGEGIEKRADDFASEVMAQVKGD